MHSLKVWLGIAVVGSLLLTHPGYADGTVSLSGLSGADLLNHARSMPQAGPAYRYDISMRVDGIDAKLTVDPTASIGQRVTVLEPAEENRSKNFQKSINQIDSDTEADIWCHDLLDQVPDSAEILTTSDQAITFGFTPLPDADADKTERKMMKKMNATLVLNRQTARVESFDMNLLKPFKPVIVAKIEKFDMRIQCMPSPDGRHFINEFFVDIAGRAMLKKFAETQTRSITSMKLITDSADEPADEMGATLDQ